LQEALEVPIFSSISVADWILITLSVVIALATVGPLVWHWWRRPRITIRPETSVDGSVPPYRFAVEIRNGGHSTAYDLSVGIRIPKAGYSEHLMTQSAPAPTHNIAITFGLLGGQPDVRNSPSFVTHSESHPFAERPQVPFNPPTFKLAWGEKYQIQLAWLTRGSEERIKCLELKMGNPDKPSLMLTPTKC
jgi:hypothetical protein